MFHFHNVTARGARLEVERHVAGNVIPALPWSARNHTATFSEKYHTIPVSPVWWPIQYNAGPIQTTLHTWLSEQGAWFSTQNASEIVCRSISAQIRWGSSRRSPTLVAEFGEETPGTGNGYKCKGGKGEGRERRRRGTVKGEKEGKRNEVPYRHFFFPTCSNCRCPFSTDPYGSTPVTHWRGYCETEICNFDELVLYAGVGRRRLPSDVAGDEYLASERLREDRRGRRRQGAQLERHLRVPARVDDERVLQPEEALQHDQGRRQPRLEGLRRSHLSRNAAQVTANQQQCFVINSN